MDAKSRLEDLFKRRKWTIALLVTAILFGAMFAATFAAPDRRVVKVSGAYAMYPLMTVWADVYKTETGARIEVSGGGAGKGMADMLSGIVDIAMVSRDIFPEEMEAGAFPIAVCRDAVVPTMNADNPVAERLASRGVSQEDFVKIFITREIRTWGELVNDSSITSPINVYTRADSCGAADTWAKYLGGYNQEDLTANADTAVMHDPDLAHAIENDRLAIGYNNVNFAYDMTTGKPLQGLRIVPIDLDGDGELSSQEDFYSNKSELMDAIASNTYPSPPSRILYLVGHHSLSKESRAFVHWVLTDGQDHVEYGGYIPLTEEIIEEQLALLGEPKPDDPNTESRIYIILGFSLIAAMAAAAFLELRMDQRKKDEIVYILLMKSAVMLVLFIAVSLVLTLAYRSIPILREGSIIELLLSSTWNPRAGSFGYYPIIAGTVIVTGLAMVLAIPISLLSSIYIAEYLKGKKGDAVKAFVDVLAGIPSVVYGMCGILVIVPFVRNYVGPFFGVETTGFCVLTAGLVLAVMVFPIIISITVGGLKAFPQHAREASLSLGASKWQTVKHTVVKGSAPTILSAVLLGFGRALGETMAVAMLVGNLPRTPSSVFSPGMTLPSFIASNYGEMMSVPLYDSAVMFAALMLLVVVTMFNVAARLLLKRAKNKWGITGGEIIG